FGAWVRQMRTGRHDRAGIGNEGLVDVVLGECHIRAVLAIEDERELVFIADAEQDERGQTRGVSLDPAHIDALALELFADEPAHVLVADAGYQPGPQPEPRCPAGDVGRGAADVLVERPHVLEPAADLCAVEVDRGSSDRYDVECPHLRSPETDFIAQCRPERYGSPHGPAGSPPGGGGPAPAQW